MPPSLDLSLMIVQLEFLVSGIVLGLAAGMSPSPLLTLVVSETLKRGRGDGIRVAIEFISQVFQCTLKSLLFRVVFCPDATGSL